MLAIFVSNEFTAFLLKEAFTWQSTVAHSSEQNGISGRGHLTSMDSGRAMIIHARHPKHFWGPAILTATYLHNLCPHSDKFDTSPYEQLWKSKPDAGHLRVFGSDAYGLLHDRTKLDAKAKKYILIGYADHQNCYVLYDPDSGNMSVHRDVQCHERAVLATDHAMMHLPSHPNLNTITTMNLSRVRPVTRMKWRILPRSADIQFHDLPVAAARRNVLR